MAGTTGLEPEQRHIGGYRRVLSSCVFSARPAPSSSQYWPILPGLLHDYCTEVAILQAVTDSDGTGSGPSAPSPPQRARRLIEYVRCCWASATPSEQIRVRSRADEVKVVAIDFIDQQPVRFDVAVAEVLPFAAERMVLVARRQRTSLDQQ
jgi:hypothetical protein